MPKKYLVLLWVAGILCGCTHSWTVSEPLDYPVATIWDASYQALSRRYDIVRASPKEREIETDWQTQKAVFYLSGYRHKVHLRIEDYQPKAPPELTEPKTSGTPDTAVKPTHRYIIKVYAPLQENRDIDNPEIQAGATWLPKGNDPDQEQIVLGFITSLLSAHQEVTSQP